MKTLPELARTAYETELRNKDLELVRAEAKIAKEFIRMFKYEPDKVTVHNLEDITLEKDGLVFSVGYYYSNVSFHLYITCKYCNERIITGPITNIIELGQQLVNPKPNVFHHCTISL